MYINKALFLDRDGVINVDKHHLYKVEDCEFVPGIFELCSYATQKGYRIFVVTNQAGIAKGYYARDDMEILHQFISNEFKKRGIIIDRFYYCPHHPEYTGECECRKPAPGLIVKASEDYNINLKNSILIGDKLSDVEAGKRAGVGTCFLLSGLYDLPLQVSKRFETLKDILISIKSKEEFKMPKRAFITGITGMVGSHLADYLMENTDWEIYGMCRWRSPLDNISHYLDRINKKDRIQLVYADLRDTISIDNAVKQVMPDYVFHLAAQSYPKTSFDSPLDTMDTNIQGTVRVLEALRKYTPKAIIHVCASSEVFGRVPKEKLPINEECTFHPASPYAISKVGTDLVGRYYAEAYGMTTMTTRMFTHTGPRRGDVFAESTFAKQIAMIEKGLIPPVVKTGNLKSLRTFADVRDAVRAYYMLVTISPIPGAYYNIGGQYTCSVEDMLYFLISLSPMKDQIKVETDPERLRPIDADLQVPDTSKFTAHTGWKPEIPFEQTMTELLNYWRQRVGNNEKFLSR